MAFEEPVIGGIIAGLFSIILTSFRQRIKRLEDRFNGTGKNEQKLCDMDKRLRKVEECKMETAMCNQIASGFKEDLRRGDEKFNQLAATLRKHGETLVEIKTILNEMRREVKNAK